MPLEPIDTNRIDPRLARHLQNGEIVLWQGAPAPNTFLTPSVLVTGFGLLLLGPALWFHFIDMLLPSRTQQMFVSYMSTFSEVAWWMGGASADVSVF